MAAEESKRTAREAGMTIGDQKRWQSSFPKEELGFQTGLAMSGGGARSCGFVYGIMCHLYSSGLLKKVDVISTSSGGGWAVVPVGYVALDKEVHTVEELLSPITEQDIRDMTPNKLNEPIPHTSALIGSSSDLNPIGFILANMTTYGNRVWCHGIGIGMLEPHGLYPEHVGTPAPLFKNEEQARACGSPTALYPRPGFPFLVHLTGLLHYDADGGKMALPYDFTPVSAGIYGPPKTVVTTDTLFAKPKTTYLDGRISTSGFDSLHYPKDAGDTDTYQAVLSRADAVVGVEKPFSIFDIAGISSFAPGSSLMDVPLMDHLVPRYIVPSSDAFYDPENVPRFTDGYSVDNTAIIPLLVRGVRNIISVFSGQNNLGEGGVLHNSDFARIFGLANDNVADIDVTHGIMSTHVFDNTGDVYNQVLTGLQQSQFSDDLKTQDGPAIFTMEITTVSNAGIGLVAGQKHTVTFVYLSKCGNFMNYISALNADLAEDITADKAFPNYAALLEDVFTSGHVITYEPDKARKLAMLGQFYACNGIDRVIESW